MAHLPARSVLIEQFIELAGLVDAPGNQHGVAVAAVKPVACLHIHQDIGDDFLQPILAAQHFLHRAPALFELRLGEIGQAFGFGLEPLIDLCL